ncbi:DNA-binding CsgD family transcriptional regulator [Nocardioides ginsengisegetis]|uniref:DNA-binding CsgD family transcriptional regulator n=1 Tax=Nocardioides ginsengisegetis TaxID=661491 RepID=A0A7W3J420_9ACTN|nr:helix-turn-helix transcriptional regulator [Nocardioides ginsengisegetis]MBA8805923.1 DNA-binding CsgD family transcriptional regulator [Nocardioides ginsengisegetis]
MIAPTVQRLVRDTTVALPDHLTARERHALALVAAGLSNPEIADRMGVATCTVRKHLEHAYRKLGVGNRLAAATALTAWPDAHLEDHSADVERFA